MIQSVKKYHYSLRLFDQCYDDKIILNATYLNGDTYVATSNTEKPVIKINVDEDGRLKDQISLPGFSDTKIKYLGFIKDKPAVVKNKWNISVLDDDCNGCKSVTINSKPNLKHKIVESILNKNTKSCRCEDCYHLIGFVEFRGFNMFVQLSCIHKPDHKLLYIIKGNLNMTTLECEDNLEVVNEYNYYRICLDNGLNEKQARKSLFTGLYYDGKKVYLISNYGKEGHLWEMSYFNNISYLGPPLLICKLRRYPKCVYSDGSKVTVLCNNIENNRLYYYIISV